MMSGVAIRRLTLTKINQAQIPLPPIQDQKRIVQEIEAEQAAVDANRELIERFEKKIQETMGRVWGETEVVGRISRRNPTREVGCKSYGPAGAVGLLLRLTQPTGWV